MISNILSFIAEQQHNTAVLFLEFEEIFGVATLFVEILIYLFYFKYPYNKEE